MIIKTITCHDVYNYGATLQSYALMKYLQNIGNEVEIIDYKPKYLERYNIWAISKKWNRNIFFKIIYYSIKVPRRLFGKESKRKRKFDKFKNEYLILTNKRYHNNTELKNAPPFADVYIAGSDQIWNTSYENGKDLAFYLDFAIEGAIKASFAASFSINEISHDLKAFVKNNISKFNFISVRESTGLNILKDLGLTGIQVCDPVFLLDRKEWIKLTLSRIINEKYILVYDFEINEEIELFVLEYANRHNLRIVNISDYVDIKFADIDKVTSGPLEFLTLIKDCECFVSNSFHGTAFSLIFNKEFYVFKRIKQKVNSRMIDLLNSLDLSNRLVTDIYNYNSLKIDYVKVNSLIDKQTKYAYNYLNSILK